MGVASGSGWNLWLWLVGVVVMRYIDLLILLYYLVSVLFCRSIPTFCSVLKYIQHLSKPVVKGKEACTTSSSVYTIVT